MFFHPYPMDGIVTKSDYRRILVFFAIMVDRIICAAKIPDMPSRWFHPVNLLLLVLVFRFEEES